MNILNTSEAAERLGISTRRVIALIDEGKLAAKKVGRDYVIEEGALMTVTVYGKAGRPPQKSAKTDKTTQSSEPNMTTAKEAILESKGKRASKKGGKK